MGKAEDRQLAGVFVWIGKEEGRGEGETAMDGGANGDDEPRRTEERSFGHPRGAGEWDESLPGDRRAGATIVAGQNRRVGSLLP